MGENVGPVTFETARTPPPPTFAPARGQRRPDVEPRRPCRTTPRPKDAGPAFDPPPPRNRCPIDQRFPYLADFEQDAAGPGGARSSTAGRCTPGRGRPGEDDRPAAPPEPVEDNARQTGTGLSKLRPPEPVTAGCRLREAAPPSADRTLSTLRRGRSPPRWATPSTSNHLPPAGLSRPPRCRTPALAAFRGPPAVGGGQRPAFEDPPPRTLGNAPLGRSPSRTPPNRWRTRYRQRGAVRLHEDAPPPGRGPPSRTRPRARSARFAPIRPDSRKNDAHTGPETA